MRFMRYILFQWNDHYPAGGLGDISGSFDTLEEAKRESGKVYHDCSEIVDRDTWETVWEQQ